MNPQFGEAAGRSLGNLGGGYDGCGRNDDVAGAGLGAAVDNVFAGDESSALGSTDLVALPHCVFDHGDGVGARRHGRPGHDLNCSAVWQFAAIPYFSRADLADDAKCFT